MTGQWIILYRRARQKRWHIVTDMDLWLLGVKRLHIVQREDNLYVSGSAKEAPMRPTTLACAMEWAGKLHAISAPHPKMLRSPSVTEYLLQHTQTKETIPWGLLCQ